MCVQELLPAINSRQPPCLTKVELCKIQAWKIGRCTKRAASLLTNPHKNEDAKVALFDSTS
jgi:hypothetical protein